MRNIRLLACGDRHWANYDAIVKCLRHLSEFYNGIAVVIEGEADGADRLSRRAAEELGIPVEPYPADWQRYGRAAGPIRNQKQLDDGKPDVAVVFHRDLAQSKGTADMVRRLRKAELPIWHFNGVRFGLLAWKKSHYHLLAGSGVIVEHVHTTPGHAHEHDGLRCYATTRRSIEKKRKAYLAERKAYLEGLAKGKR